MFTILNSLVLDLVKKQGNFCDEILLFQILVTERTVRVEEGNAPFSGYPGSLVFELRSLASYICRASLSRFFTLEISFIQDKDIIVAHVIFGSAFSLMSKRTIK